MPIGKAEQKALMVGGATALYLSKGYIFGTARLPNYILPAALGTAGTQYFLSESTNDWTSKRGLGKHKWKLSLLIAGGYLVTRNMNGFLPRQGLLSRFQTHPWLTIRRMGYMTLGAPIAEEILYRGFIQERLEEIQTWSGKDDRRIRIALQAIIFGATHIQPGDGLANLVFFGGPALFGCVAGYLKEESGSLAAPMALHIANNTSHILLRCWLG